MVPSAIEVLESRLGSQAAHNSIIDNGNSIAEDICLLHAVGGQDDGTVLILFALLEDVPKMASSFRIKTSRWLIKEYNLWV